MILRLIAIGTCLVAGLSLSAANLKLDVLEVGSTTYSNVTVLGATTTDLFFKHDGGVANVKLRYLSDDLKKEFNFDPSAAARAEQKQLAEDAMFHTYVATNAARRAAAGRPAAPPQSSADNLVDPISDRSLLGKTAPPLQVDKWITDKPDVEGKCVLIDFVVPWSTASRKEIPVLNGLQKKFAGKLVVVGVVSATETEAADMEGPRIEFPCGIDARSRIAALAGVTTVPSVLLLDAKGVVRYQGHPAALSDAAVKSVIDRPAE